MNDKTLRADERESEQILQINPYAQLMEKAIETGGVEQLEKLMALQERYERHQARKAFYSALSAFQSELTTIPKSGKASFFSTKLQMQVEYSYAKLEDIVEAIKEPLSRHGLSYRFEQKQIINGTSLQMLVRCVVTHEDGYSESTELAGFPDNTGTKNPIQALGSTDTYLRRYTLTGALGIVSGEDDDGAESAPLPNDDQTPGSGLNYYTEEQFDAFFPSWKSHIQTGMKTPSGIIKFLETKGWGLTTMQSEKLRQIKVTNNN